MKESIRFGDKDYSLVPVRLKKFREENPRADIDTNPTLHPDGSVTFKTRIVKDLSDESSARSSGTARYVESEMKKPKAFEKLETISVGRALANLGYLNDGQIATTEEMEEFEKFKTDRKNEAIESAITRIEASQDINGLKSIFVSLGELMTDPDVIAAKDKRKAELNENN